MPPKKVTATKTPEKSKTTTEKYKKEFVWSDDESELLLNVANDYKAAKAAECVHWESVKTKYKDIFELFVAGIPEEGTTFKNYPHKKEEIKLHHITAKLKAIRVKFRYAVDSGWRSGHGRVIIIYHKLCAELWGGSPATDQIVGGIETTELAEDSQSLSESFPSTPCTTTTVQSQPVDFKDSDAESEDVQNEEETGHQATVKKEESF